MTGHTLVRTDDGLVVKRFRPDAGDQARREWRALRILHEHAPGLAPAPVSADLDAGAASVTMTAVPGTPLGGRPLSESEMDAVLVALDRLHTGIPREVLDDVPMRINAPREVAGSLADRLAAQRRPRDDVTGHAYDEAIRWLSGTDAARLASDGPRRTVLARADHNLTNFLWDGHRVRLIDFEYSGRSDRCSEIAELIEHISARCTSDGSWQRLLDGVELSRAERARLITNRRLAAILWLFLLLPGQPGEARNPPGTLRAQAERTLGLLGA